MMATSYQITQVAGMGAINLQSLLLWGMDETDEG